MNRKRHTALGTFILLLIAAGPAAAHHPMGGTTPATLMQGLLSGFGHPIIGLDHLAAIVAIGCLAATQARGPALIIGYVITMMLGVAMHVRGTTVPGAELLVAITVVALGAVLAALRVVPIGLTFALFAIAGLAHGYALGESIVGAEPTPLIAYFFGLAVVQAAIALAAMQVARAVLVRRFLEPLALRLLGAMIVGFGLAALAQQVMPGA